MIEGILVLFGITLLGSLIACKVFAYEIPLWRKVGAAVAFAVLNAIPIPYIPFVDILLPALALYVILMDDTYQRSQVNKVFGLTFVIAVVGVVLVYMA